MKNDIEKLKKIAHILIEAGNEVGERNGLPYCKNCSLDLIDLGNTIGIIAENFEKQFSKKQFLINSKKKKFK